MCREHKSVLTNPQEPQRPWGTHRAHFVETFWPTQGSLRSEEPFSHNGNVQGEVSWAVHTPKPHTHKSIPTHTCMNVHSLLTCLRTCTHAHTSCT